MIVASQLPLGEGLQAQEGHLGLGLGQGSDLLLWDLELGQPGLVDGDFVLAGLVDRQLGVVVVITSGISSILLLVVMKDQVINTAHNG